MFCIFHQIPLREREKSEYILGVCGLEDIVSLVIRFKVDETHGEDHLSSLHPVIIRRGNFFLERNKDETERNVREVSGY